MPPLQNVCVVTTFYTLVGILSILFSGVALDIITCRPPSPAGRALLPPFLMNEQDGCAALALLAVGGYLQAGLTAALNFEAIKPRIFNAIAVGEMHHIAVPSRLITKSRSHRLLLSFYSIFR